MPEPITASTVTNEWIDAAVRLATFVDVELQFNDCVAVSARLVEHVERFRTATTNLRNNNIEAAS